MPANLDYELYFNIAFFGAIGVAFLFGYLRGLKKSLYSLVTTLIFYALFFYTIDVVVSFLWTSPLPFVFDNLAVVEPTLGNANSFGEALTIALNTYLSDYLVDSTLTNEVFLSLATGLGQFILKLAYTLIYFTAGNIVYKFIMMIIRMIFFSGGKKDKHANKHRLFGALAGAAKGSVTVFISIIMLGGIFNILDSMLILLPNDATASANHTETLYLSTNDPQFQALDNTILSSEQDSTILEARNMVAAYNSNLFVTTTSGWQTESENYADPVQMNLYLFDSVLSFDFQEDRVYLRNELESLAGVAELFVSSEYAQTNDLTDITKDEVIGTFETLANSTFIVNVLPLAIEVGSDYMDVEVDIPVDELYDIDWKSELNNLGVIAGVGFEILNTAGMLEADPDLETVQFDGTKVNTLFDSLADSELATMAAFIVLEPLVDGLEGTLGAVITIPEGLDWAVEFRAFGLVAKEVLDQNITMADIDTDDPTTLISTMADLDFSVLLDSQIVSHALKNILSGDAGIEGLDIIVVPLGTIWFDVLNLDGTVAVPGELRNILNAISAIVSVVDDFSLTDIGIDMISDLTDASIDTIFDSGVLVATISDYLMNMELGDTPLIIPDAVLDLNGYITKTEMKQVANSAKVLVTDLACTEGDTACEDGTGFDFGKAFDLADTSVDTLLGSEILGASIGQLVIDSGGDTVTIPTSATVTVTVDGVPQDVVSRDEIKKMFTAVSALGFTDLDNMSFDASIIDTIALASDDTKLDTDKADDLFASKIVHATISKMLFDQTEGVDSNLIVPELKQDGVTPVVTYSIIDDMDYLETAELKAILQALITLEIADFAEVGNLDINVVIDNSAELLKSSILQATISKQLIDLPDGTIVIPDSSVDNTPIKLIVGTVTYVDRDEIVNVLDVLKLLDITDINNFSGEIDIATIIDTPGNMDIMLESGIIHATISEQILDLEVNAGAETALVIPYVGFDDVRIRTTVGSTTFVTKIELTALMDSLKLLGIEDITAFDGAVALDVFYEVGARDTLFSSAIMHASMSKQIIDLDGNELDIPEKDIDDNFIQEAHGIALEEVDYINTIELHAIFEALELLGVLDISTFDGVFAFEDFDEESEQVILLDSGLIHYTVSSKLLDLDLDGTIIVPEYEQDGLTEIRKTVVVGEEFVVKGEVKALINALNAMDFDDPASASGNIESSKFFDERVTLLASASIQATISDKMINGTSGVLVIPDVNVYDGNSQVRIVGPDTTVFIDIDEMNAILDALEAMGLTDFTAMDFNPLNVFAPTVNKVTILASASIQATISNTILPNAVATAAPGTTTLIIPAYFRENITEDGVVKVQVEHDELLALLYALEALDVTDFNGGMSGSTITSLTATDIDTLLTSGSLHTTIDNMFRVNSNITDNIHPSTMQTTEVYKTDILLKAEVKSFILATKELSASDFGTVTFDAGLFTTVESTSSRTLIFDSMIIRKALSGNLETAVIASQLGGSPYSPVPVDADYTGGDKTNDVEDYLNKVKFLDILEFFYPATS